MKRHCAAAAGLLAFGLFFTYGLLTLRDFVSVPEYADHYFPLRQWFVGQLLQGHFPLWNPGWGLGEPFGWFLTIPLDLYTPFEILFGPIYNVFYAVQFLALLAAAYWALSVMRMPPGIALFGACLFAAMPSVTFYYFYFVKAHSYIVYTLLFVLAPLYIFSGRRQWLVAIYATVFLGLFGTKAEYWFFNAIMYVFTVVAAAAVAAYSGRVPVALSLRRIAYAGAVFGLACLSQLWQINMVWQEIRLGGRDMGSAMDVLSFLRLTIRSLVGSPLLLMLAATAPLAYGLWRHRFGRGFLILPIFSFLMVAAVLSTAMIEHLGNSTFAVGFVEGLLTRPTALAIPLAVFVWWVFAPERSLRAFLGSAVLFLPIIYYWFQPADLLAHGEYGPIMRTPAVLQFLLIGLIWLGMSAVGRDFWTSLAWASLVFVLLLREDGQLILWSLTGNTWIVDRDSYILQFDLIVLAAAGLRNFCQWPSVAGLAARAVPGAAPSLLSWTAGLVCLALLVAGLWPNPYYSHPLVERSPPDYPFYRGVPGVNAAFAGLKREGADRIFLINKFTKAMTYGFGEALLNGLSQVTYYSSTIPRYVLDWSFFQRYGKEVDDWVAYNGAYTPRMLRQFPPSGNPAVDQYEAYVGTIIARPVVDANMLRILGVTHVGYFDRSLNDDSVGYHDLIDRDTLDKRWRALQLKDIEEIPVGYYVPNAPDGKPYPKQNFVVGHLADPFPRAFLVHGLTAEYRKILREDWHPAAGDGTLISGGHAFPISGATVERPDTEHVRVRVDDPQGGLVVLSDLYHPFWSASLDGQPIGIEPVLKVLRGVEVPPGIHELDFSCDIPNMTAAVTISLISFLSSLTLFWVRRRRDGRNARG